MGVGLFYYPPIENGLFIQNATLSIKDALIPQADPYGIGQITYAAATKLSDIFRGLLGETGGTIITIPDNFQQTHITGFSTRGDWVSCIDWDDLDDKTSAFQKDLGISYEINLSRPINIYKLFVDELILHGLTPTWEWDQSDGMFKMRFRHVGAINISTAIVEGRYIAEKNINYGEVPQRRSQRFLGSEYRRF